MPHPTEELTANETFRANGHWMFRDHEVGARVKTRYLLSVRSRIFPSLTCRIWLQMEGILIPIVGLMTSAVLGLVCALIPRLRSYLLPALVAPFATGIIFLFGCFILADMNPAREYGATYVSTGK
jgi:hypothetical protein